MIKRKVIELINKYLKIILNDEELHKKYYELCVHYKVGLNPSTKQCKQYITNRADNDDIEKMADIIIITFLEE